MISAIQDAAGQDTLLAVGNPAVFHVGAHFLQAARSLSIPAEICDTRSVFDAPWPVVQFHWRLLGHRPPRLAAFERRVLAQCQALRPRWLLATGTAPLTAATLHSLHELGITLLNFLTDDPWNPAHRARWFLEALPSYDKVFSPRYANLADLRKLGCRQVHYLPFAYAPEIHYPERPTPEEQDRYQCDVLFYGGADADRLPYVYALLDVGLNVHLYGGYWDRHPRTRPYFKGHADPATLRKAVASAKVTLCLVRRANRDGHVMRTFEAPAMCACMATEDTAEHRALLGEDRANTLYFSGEGDLVEKVRYFLARPGERTRLAQAAHGRITSAPNTYADRLQAMLADLG